MLVRVTELRSRPWPIGRKREAWRGKRFGFKGQNGRKTPTGPWLTRWVNEQLGASSPFLERLEASRLGQRRRAFSPGSKSSWPTLW